MAFRILPTGVVETDTPAEVMAMFGAMGIAIELRRPRLLASGANGAGSRPEIVIAAAPDRPARGRPKGKKAPRVPPGRRAAGGGRRSTPAVSDDVGSRILQALADGALAPRELWKRVGADRVAVQHALRPLLRSGGVRAEGATASRRLMLGSTRAHKPAAPAKEDL